MGQIFEGSPSREKALEYALRWFVDREPALQAKFDLYGPEDTAGAMKIAFRSAKAAIAMKPD